MRSFQHQIAMPYFYSLLPRKVDLKPACAFMAELPGQRTCLLGGGGGIFQTNFFCICFQSRAIFLKDLSHPSHLKMISRLTAIPFARWFFLHTQQKGKCWEQTKPMPVPPPPIETAPDNLFPRLPPCSLPLCRI